MSQETIIAIVGKWTIVLEDTTTEIFGKHAFYSSLRTIELAAGNVNSKTRIGNELPLCIPPLIQ